MRFFTTVCLLLLSCSSLADTRGFDVRDLVSLDRLSGPQVSPDGELVVFTVREADLENNKGETGIFALPLGGAESTEPKRLTAKGVSSVSPTWSPSGDAVFFLSARSGTMQVWRLGMQGGEASQVTDFPLDVTSFRLSPSGDRLAVSMEVFIDCEDLSCTTERLDGQAKADTSGVLYDKLFIRHWDTWKDGRRSQLFTAELDEQHRAGRPVWVTRGVDGDIPSKPFGDAGDYTFSPDGKQLAYSVRHAGREEAWSTNFDIFLVAADGAGKARNLTEANKALDTGPVFSRDGKTLYYRAMRRAGFEADRLAIKALELASGELREIAPDWDRSAYGIHLSADGDRIYTTAAHIGQRPLFSIDLATDKVTQLTDVGSVGGFDLASDRAIVAINSLTSPADLYSVPVAGGDAERLTELNAERLQDVDMGDYEQFSFAGWNDETVYGYVVKPAGFKKNRKYPLAFLIHGGPQGSFGDSFHYRWNPQTYAGQGFVSVMIDFHGSTGYGQEFTDSISGDWGGKPLEDLQKGLAYALETYDFIDGDRACALGASYGGYMINWIAGNWNEPFDCLVNHDGIFDNRFMGYSTEELWFTEWEMGGPAFANPEGYERHNPVNHVDNWQRPMLVIHGALDHRVPLEQGIAAFTALQRKGIESQFLYYPDENHWVLQPANSIQWHDTVKVWLKRWTGQ